MTDSKTGIASWPGAHYDSVSHPQFGWGIEILSRLGDIGDGAVLDAGCGSGRVTEVLCTSQAQAHLTALDISPSMLDEARRRLARFDARVRYVCADLNGNLAEVEAHGPFNAVLSTGTFHWVKDHSELYRKLFMMLAPGGILVAQCGGEGSVLSVRSALEDIGVQWRGFNCYAGAVESFQWLQQAGFCDVWTWLSPEPVAFDGREALVDYLLGGVLSPYIAHLDTEARRRVAESVADRLESKIIDFVRLNILARRPK
jgi:trans-aconitate 2-methyltransferase